MAEEPKKVLELGNGYSIKVLEEKVLPPLFLRAPPFISFRKSKWIVFELRYPKQKNPLKIMGWKIGSVFHAGVTQEESPNPRPSKEEPKKLLNPKVDLPAAMKLFPHVEDYLKKEGVREIRADTHEKLANLLVKGFGFHTKKRGMFRTWARSARWRVTKKLAFPRKRK